MRKTSRMSEMLRRAERRPSRAVTGADYSGELRDEANTNADMPRESQMPIVVENGIAEEFSYSDATVLYFFCPFGPTTLDAVLHKIRADGSGNGVRVALVNLFEVRDEVFPGHGWPRAYDRWETGEWVKFWRQTDGIWSRRRR